jgi:hypothetical protein
MPGVAPRRARRAVRLDGRTMAAIHRLDIAALGLSDYGRPGNYFRARSRAGRSSGRSTGRATTTIPHLDRMIAWLGPRIPDSEKPALCHGDFRIGNVMFHPTEPRVIGVLDWELSTLGAPLVDVAFNTQAWRMAPDENGGLLGLDLAALGIPAEDELSGRLLRACGAARRMTDFPPRLRDVPRRSRQRRRRRARRAGQRHAAGFGARRPLPRPRLRAARHGDRERSRYGCGGDDDDPRRGDPAAPLGARLPARRGARGHAARGFRLAQCGAVQLQHPALDDARAVRRQPARRWRARWSRRPTPAFRPIPISRPTANSPASIASGRSTPRCSSTARWASSATTAPRRDWAYRRNLEFFGAPHAVLVFMHGEFEEREAVDLGIYAQTLMLAMTARGIACCAQGRSASTRRSSARISAADERTG